VTGGNVGLGFASCEALASRGAHVFLGCRRAKSGEDAVRRIRERSPDARVEVLPLDLVDSASIAAFSAAVVARVDRIDVLMNNAGVVNHPSLVHTQDGHELQMATNHFGHFALTGRLYPKIVATLGARVVTLSSAGSRGGEIRFDDLDWRKREYSRVRAYGDSKLANLHFTRSLEQRFRKTDTSAISIAAHPGLTGTERQQSIGIGGFVTRWFASPVSDGVRSQLFGATASGVVGGDYFVPRYGLRGEPKNVRGEIDALDDAIGERLWQVSEDVTGVTYDAKPA